MSIPSINSVGNLVAHIVERVRLKNRILWFRGHRCSSWDVSPAIWRDYGKDDERNFTNRFRSRAATRYESLPEYNNWAIWLSLMQHCGLLTRLLDWTRSPLVVAYFALERYLYEKDSEAEDASIWVLEPHALNALEELGDVTPSIDAHMCKKMLRPAFTHIASENNKVLAVMVAEQDMRMFVQQGCFTIHSDPQPLNKRSGKEHYLTELIIPAKYVKGMAFEVNVCGFRRGDMFPDLGHLAEELKGTYAPSRAKPSI